MALVKCADCGREVSDKAPACPQCGRPMAGTVAGKAPPKPAELATGCATLLVLAGGVVGYFWMCSGDDTPPAAPASVAEAVPKPTAPPAPVECRISIPGYAGWVAVFPTEEGLDEYVSASVRDDQKATEAAIVANNAFIVSRRTLCARIDTGFTVSRIRVLEGPHEGKGGWLPNEWTRGQ